MTLPQIWQVYIKTLTEKEGNEGSQETSLYDF